MDLKCIEASATLATYNKVYWNSNFINELRLLPDAFDGSTIIEAYEEFWDTYGTHIVKSGMLS